MILIASRSDNYRLSNLLTKIYTMSEDIIPQLVEKLTLILWGHHRIIIDKFKTLEKCFFHIKPVL